MDMIEEMHQYTALLAQIAALQQQADNMLPRIRARAAAAVRAIIAEHRLDHGDLLAAEHKAAKGLKLPKVLKEPDVRYRNPGDHSQTWSGHGRAPHWIAGQDRAPFAVAP